MEHFAFGTPLFGSIKQPTADDSSEMPMKIADHYTTFGTPDLFTAIKDQLLN